MSWAGKLSRGDEQFVKGWALSRQRGWRRQPYEGKAGSTLVLTNTQRANSVSDVHLKVTSDSKGAGRSDL